MDILQAKKEVIAAGLRLVETGLIARTWGNVSCRVDENSFVITPSGKPYDGLTPDDIVEVKIDTLSYEGSPPPKRAFTPRSTRPIPTRALLSTPIRSSLP